jgi:hypothetical protein
MDNFYDEIIEIWKPIVGYEGIYAVSNFGRVRRDCGGSNNAIAGRILKASKDDCGYSQVRLCVGGIASTFKVHRLVALNFIGPRPEGLEINHIDGKKDNNFVGNLEYVTSLYNNQHAGRLGLKIGPKGEKCNLHKLNANQVNDIRENCSGDINSLRLFSEKHCISTDNIRLILKNRIWKHLLSVSA